MNYLNDIVFMNAVQYILTIVLGAAGTWALAQLTPGIVAGIKEGWHAARVYKPQIIAAVDQVDDPLIQLAGNVGIPREIAVKIAPRVLKMLFEAADEITGEK